MEDPRPSTSNEDPIVSGKLETAIRLKKEGNEYYRRQNIKKAIRSYHNALLYLKGVTHDITPDAMIPRSRPVPYCSPALKAEVTTLTTDLHNNLAACLLKQHPIRYERVIDHCEVVTEEQPNNVKALYRMGLAHHHLRDNDKAKEALKKANSISKGKDMIVRRLLIAVEQELKKEDKKFNDMFRNTLDIKKL